MIYPPVEALRELHITQLHSLYYFHLDPADRLEGERHDFWELVYVDEGCATIQSEQETYLLRQGELFLHAPNRYHQIHLSPDGHPNVLIFSFSLEKDCLSPIQNMPLETNRRERLIFSRLLEEGAALYGPLLDCHRDLSRDRLSSARFGTLQMIVNYLELVLIELMRSRQEHTVQTVRQPIVTQEEGPKMLVEQLKNYMREHLCDNLTFADCCQYLNMSGTSLKALFRSQNEQGVMHCYQRMRAAEARRMLRSGKWNVTQVAAELGYSSCQAFSTQFRKLMGASPTAYLRRVAAEPESLTSQSFPDPSA